MHIKKIIILFILFILLSFLNLNFVYQLYEARVQFLTRIKILNELKIDQYASVINTPASSIPLVLGAIESETIVEDGRAENLKSFFNTYDSPLESYAQFIVDISDKYGFDYRLLPAIAMQESTGCKIIPHNSFNCWGYGIYGDKVTRFSNYEEAIDTVARGLKKNYIDKGLVTPGSIMQRYTPSSEGSWANAIRFFFNKLDTLK